MTTAIPQPGQTRKAGLDLMKFFFALMIMLHHARSLFPSLPLFEGCYIGVDFFFLTSGLFMAKTAETALGGSIATRTVQYFHRRLNLLIPCYLVAYLLYFLLVQWLGPTSLNHFLNDAILSLPGFLLLEMAGFYTCITLPGSWYLSAMLLAQLLIYPLLLWKRETFSKVVAPLTAILLLGYLSKNFGSLGNPTAGSPLVYNGLLEAIAILCLGIFCYSLLSRFELSRLSQHTRWLGIVPILLIVFLFACFRGKSQLDFFLIPSLIALILLAYGLSLPSGLSKAVRWLGAFSYPLYLTHMPVLFLLKELLPGTAPLPLALLYTAGSLIAALLCMQAGKLLSARFGK